MEPKYSPKYNRGFSGQTFKREFELSEAAQKRRVGHRGGAYEEWKRQGKEICKSDIKNTPSKIKDIGKLGTVASSWLTSLGYIGETGEAVATFKGVNAEFYYKMDYDTFLEWLNSPSKGRWLHDHKSIMENYKVRGGTGKKTFSSRITNARKPRGASSNGTARAKARVRKYLEKYR